MSEQENVQIVQRIYKAFVEGDIPAVLNLVTDDAEHQDFFSAKIPWAGLRRGRYGVEQFLRKLAEALEVQVFQPDEFIAGGDSVVVLGHEGCGCGQPVAWWKPTGHKSGLSAMA